MRSIKSMMMGGAILLGLSMCLTSCEGTLDDVFGEWSRPTGNNNDNTKTTVAVTSITLDQTTLTKAVGADAVTLKATVAPDDATEKTVTWKSSDESVATVDENGKVTFKALGTATITATATNGTEDTADDKTAECAVTVNNTITVYVNVSNVSWTKVYFHTWGGDGSHGTDWPGAEATTTKTVGGKTWYAKTYDINSTTDFVNFVFSDGSGTGDLGEKQTVDVNNVTTDKYFDVSTAKDDAGHRKVYQMAANATAADKGKLICADGHIHAYGEDAECTKDRVAKIVYVGSSTGDDTYKHGLALAMENIGTDDDMSWDAANPNNGGKTAIELCSAWNTSKPVTCASWMLPSKDQWDTMINVYDTYTDLRDSFSSVGGKDMNTHLAYWSSTESTGNFAWAYAFGTWVPGCGWMDAQKDTNTYSIRACLVF